MAGKATLAIDIIADASKAQVGFNQSISSVQQFSDSMRSLAIPAGVGFAAVTAGLKSSVEAASNMNETLSKINVVFGQQATAMQSWANTAATSMGLSSQAALEAASTFGNMFQQLGFAAPAAAQMSEQMVQLAGDLASFNNLDTGQVLDALQGAFRGEYDALQRMVPSISAAAVQQQALADTGKTSASALTDQEKAAATMQIVLSQTSKAQGDFKRTANGMANSQRTANAEWDNAKTTLGEKLLPAMTQALKVLTDLTNWISNHTTDVLVFATAFGTITAAVLAYNVGVQIAKTATAAWTAVQWLLDAAMDANPIGLIVIAIAALVAAIVLIATKTDWFQKLWSATWGAVRSAAEAVVNWLTGPFVGFFQTVWNDIESGVQSVENFFSTVWDGIKSAAQAVVNWFTGTFAGAFTGAWNSIKQGVDTLKTNVSNGIDAIYGLFRDLPGRITSALSKIGTSMWDGLKKSINAGIDLINRAANAFNKIPGIPNIPSIPRVQSAPLLPNRPGLAQVVPLSGMVAPTAGLLARAAAPLVNLPAVKTTVQAQAVAVPTQVRVYMGDVELTNFVQRVVTKRLNAEGNRLASGAWA